LLNVLSNGLRVCGAPTINNVQTAEHLHLLNHIKNLNDLEIKFSDSKKLVKSSNNKELLVPSTSTTTTTKITTTTTNFYMPVKMNETGDSNLFIDLEFNILNFEHFEEFLNKSLSSNNKTNKINQTTSIINLNDTHVYNNNNNNEFNLELGILNKASLNNSTVYSSLSKIINKINVKDFFATHRPHFLVILICMASLIILLLIIMIYSLAARRKSTPFSSSSPQHNSNANQLNKKLKYKKKNASFDIIDSGYYKPTRRSSSSLKIVTSQQQQQNLSGQSIDHLDFEQSNSTTTDTQLAVDYDYHQFDTNHSNDSEATNNNHHSSSNHNHRQTFDKIMTMNFGDHLYDLPQNHQNNQDSSSDALRFKTFSVRKFEKEQQKLNNNNSNTNSRVMTDNSSLIYSHLDMNKIQNSNPVFQQLQLQKQQQHTIKINEIYEPSISICFDKISLSDLSSVDKQSF
jgi:hypothetical protein